MKQICAIVLLLVVLGASSGCGFLFSSEEPAPTPVPTGPPHADFIAEPRQIEGKDWVQFTSVSTGNIKHWSWVVGNGRAYSGPQCRSYFSNDGYYTVTLRVETWDGQVDTMVKPDYIYVYGCG